MAGGRAGIVKDTPERQALLAERAELVNKITKLKATPLPGRDRQLHEKYRLKDLTELASKIVKIDIKLGRTKMEPKGSI